MFHRRQPLKSFALLLLLAICLTVKTVQAQDYYEEYRDLDYDEAMAVFYGDHTADDKALLSPPLVVVDPVSPQKNQTQNATEDKQETTQKNPESQEERQVASEQIQVLADQSSQDASAIGPDVELRQLAAQNTRAIKKIAGVMSDVVSKMSTQGCLGAGESGVSSNMQALSNSIKEGFTVLVGAVQDLNATMHHYQAEISRKAFGTRNAATTFENDGPCPAPFFPVGKDCLFIETEHLRDFHTARQACIDMGAKLAEFTNYEPFIEAVRNMDLHRNAEVLIGGTDRGLEGSWKWLSGGVMPPIIWGSGEPNNIDSNEHCVALNARWGKFNDIQCSFRREYVCQWTPTT